MADDKSVIEARGKKNMLWAIVTLVAVTGSLYEYHQQTAPLDELVIFLPQPSPKTLKTKENAPKTETPKAEIIAPTSQETFKEFFAYMEKINEQANKLISYEGSALSHIKRAPAIAKTVTSDTQIFEDGKIEIYDSQKGVIDVVDTKSSANRNKDNGEADKEQIEIKNSGEETPKMSEQEQQEAIAQQKIQQQVAKDLEKAAETGEEAPVVLLPGIGIPSVAKDEEETIDLEQISDEVTTDAEKINRAMEQVEKLNIDGLVPELRPQETSESAEAKKADTEIKILEDDGADGGVINMLNQITAKP